MSNGTLHIERYLLYALHLFGGYGGGLYAVVAELGVSYWIRAPREPALAAPTPARH